VGSSKDLPKAIEAKVVSKFGNCQDIENVESRFEDED
jgi:hypothetical protein